jgi:hypothetical protein
MRIRLHPTPSVCRREVQLTPSVVELMGFYLLNINLPVLQAPSGGELFSDAVFQSLAVRASGFGILPVANFSPALLFLYVVSRLSRAEVLLVVGIRAD